MLAPGQIVAGKYRVDRLLGRGGMGAVYVATNLVLEKQVALKVMGGGFLANPDWVQRFFREGVAASKVRHPGVVSVFDAGEHDGAPWMAMELLEGESLRERLARSGRLGVEELLPIARQVLGALAAVHAVGVVHRDLKPDNIFLERTAEGLRAKVLDFGIAKEAHAITSLTATGAIIGTAHYLAPEQARDSRVVDARTDIYAFGVILFECLSGLMPYEATTVPELIAKMYTEPPRSLAEHAPDVPASIARIVHACLAHEPSARPESAAALLEALAIAEQPGAATGAHAWAGASPASSWPATSASSPASWRAGPASGPPGSHPSGAGTTYAPAAAPKRPMWPWILGGLTAVVLGGMGLLVAVVMLGAFAAATQRSASGGDDTTVWDSPRVPMIADADGDGREDVIGSVLQRSSSGDAQTSFAAYDGASGRQLWRTESLGSAQARAHSRAAVWADTLVYADASGQLQGFALRTGLPRFRVSLGERAARFCRGDGASVLVETADQRLTRVALADGASRPAENAACVPLPGDDLPRSRGTRRGRSGSTSGTPTYGSRACASRRASETRPAGGWWRSASGGRGRASRWSRCSRRREAGARTCPASLRCRPRPTGPPRSPSTARTSSSRTP
ncbi:MAG: serine/threonine protein kinase [Sandaracinaceae bacterium]|nr:serine/threonine protein kinase [Sandaracinaceae bacterium]